MIYSIRLTHPDLVFTADHAIRYDSGELEKVHRHTFRARLEIAGPMNAAGYVVDFLAAFHILKRLLRHYDGMTFLPNGNENPTAEHLVATILKRFHDEAVRDRLFAHEPEEYRLRLELEEEPGMWAICQLP